MVRKVIPHRLYKDVPVRQETGAPAVVGRRVMARIIGDDEIQSFLQRNAHHYPSQISLIQAAVDLLWPEGAPTGGAERVVRVCLDGAAQRPSGSPPSGRLLGAPGTSPI